MIVKVNSFVITEKEQGSCYEQVLEGLSPYGLKRDIETNFCRALELYWVKRGLKSPFEKRKPGEKRQLYIVRDIINTKLKSLELIIPEDKVSEVYNIEYEKLAQIKQEQAEIIEKFKEGDEEDKNLFGEEGRFIVNYTVYNSWNNIRNEYSTNCHNYDEVEKMVNQILNDYDHEGDYAPYHLELKRITVYDRKQQASFEDNFYHRIKYNSPYWVTIGTSGTPLGCFLGSKDNIRQKLEHSLKTEGIAFRFKYIDTNIEMYNNQSLMNVFEYYISESIPECIAYYLYRQDIYQSKCDFPKENVQAYPESFGDLKICNLKDFDYIQTEWYDVCKDKFSELYCQYRSEHDVYEFGEFYRTIKSEWEQYFQQQNTKRKINKRKMQCK